MYSAKVTWYDEYSDKDVVSCILVCASSWGNAMDLLNESFPEINELHMELIVGVRRSIVAVPESMFDAIVKENLY